MDNHIDEKIKHERVKILMNLSEELEKKYMNKFINKEVVFIPEIEKNGYLIGHTGNYLQVKIEGNKDLIGKDVKVMLKEVVYPYIIGEKID